MLNSWMNEHGNILLVLVIQATTVLVFFFFFSFDLFLSLLSLNHAFMMENINYLFLTSYQE